MRSDYDSEFTKAVETLKERLPTCLNCFNFDEKSELCALAKQRPPARVIAFGCPSFDLCPF